MRILNLFMLAIAITACKKSEEESIMASQSLLQCAKDTDCKGDRICDKGQCTNPTDIGAVTFKKNLATNSSRVIDANGLGGAMFGMTVSEFSHAMGEKFSEPQDPEQQSCFYLEPRMYQGIAFMFENHRLSRIDVDTKMATTSDGVTVGTSTSELDRLYGSRLRHDNGFDGEAYQTLSLGPTLAVRFVIRENKVDNFYVGYNATIQYYEGCY